MYWGLYLREPQNSSRKKQNFNGIRNVYTQRGSVSGPCPASIDACTTPGSALAPSCLRMSMATKAECCPGTQSSLQCAGKMEPLDVKFDRCNVGWSSYLVRS